MKIETVCPYCGAEFKPIAGRFYHEVGCPRRVRPSKDPYKDTDGRDVVTPEQGE